MARESFSSWNKKQNKYEEQEFKRQAKAEAARAKQMKRDGYVQSESEIGDTNIRLNHLSQMAADIKAKNKRSSQAYKSATKLLKSAVNSENNLRQSTQGRVNSPSLTPSKSNPIIGQNSYYNRLQDMATKRRESQYTQAVNKQEQDRKAYLYKYGDVENMSGKEISDRIEKLENEKAQREAERQRDAQVKGNVSYGSGAGSGNISSILNSKGLSKSQLETMSKLDADADDKLEVYRKALPQATLRDEEKKLTDKDKERIEKVADFVRGRGSGTRIMEQMGGNIGGALANVRDAQESEARATLDDLKKKGIDTDYLVDSYAIIKNNAEAEANAKASEDWAKESALNSVLSSAATVLASPFTAIQGATADLSHAARNTFSDKPLPVDQSSRWASKNTQAIRQGVSEKIDSPVWSFIYNAGMSTGDSAMALLTGSALGGAAMGSKVTQAIMSAGAADQTYNEALDRGLDVGHALATALTAGVAEWATEKYSIDGLKKMASARPDKLRTAIMNIGKQMATEGSEEAASDVFNAIGDAIINGKKSEFNQKVKEYKAQGLTQEQARKAAMMDWLSQTAYDAAAGALSGGIMGAGAQAMGYNQVSNELKSEGITIAKAGELSEVIDYAKQFKDLTKEAKKADSERGAGALAETIEKKIIKDVSEAETAEELQAVYEVLSVNAPSSVGVTIESAVRDKATELSEKAEGEEKEALEGIYETATDNYINASNTLEQKLQEGNNETDEGRIESGETDKGVAVNNRENEEKIEQTHDQRQSMDDSLLEETKETQPETNEEVYTPTEITEQGKAVEKVEPKIVGNKQARLIDSGENVTIEGFVQTGVDDVQVKIDGDTDSVALKDLEFSDPFVERMYQVAAKFDDAAAASAMISNYDGKQNTAVYAENFEKAYNYGTVDLSYDTMMKKTPFVIPESLVKLAYSLGKNHAEEVSEAKTVAKGTGTAVDERDEIVKGDGYGDLDKALAKKLGVDIKLVDKAKDANGKYTDKINGYLDISKGQMVFTDAAESKLGVRIHETMEFIDAVDPETYSILMQVVFGYMAKETNLNSVYDMVMNYRDTYREAEGSKTFNEALGEFMNDAISGVFMSEDGAKDFIAWVNGTNLDQQEKNNIFKAAVKIILDLIDKIKDSLSYLTKAQKVTANMQIKSQEEIRDIFFDAAERAIEKYQNGEAKAGEKIAASRNSVKVHSLKVEDMSKKELDDAYQAAVESKDEEKQAELVREAATRAGYDSPMLYHGTQVFGFTVFDMDKMDDGRSLFATDSQDIASSYSGENKTRDINTEEEAEKKREKHRLEELYKSSTNKERLEYARSQAPDMNYKAATQKDVEKEIEYHKNENKESIKKWKQILAERKKDPDYNISEASAISVHIETLENIAEWLDSAQNKKIIKAGLETNLKRLNRTPVLADNFSYHVDINNTEALIDYIDANPNKYLAYDMDGITGLVKTKTLFEVEAVDEYADPVHAIYKLYGKTENMFEIDAEGRNWHSVPITDEMSEDEELRISKDESTKELTTGIKAGIKTRSISWWAQKHGYNGVIIKNVTDNGGRMQKWYDEESYRAASKPGTIRIFFSPSDIKSADNITYDEKGEVIPLSKRFNEEKEDIRYSLKVDTEGKELSKGQQEYFKDSKIVDEEGRLRRVYHGSGRDFNIFDLDQARDTEDIEAFFFTGDKEEAEGYGPYKEYYLNITNPADYDTAYGIFNKYKGQAGAGRLTREELQKAGYDGVIAEDEDAPEYTEYLAFTPEQIKLTSNTNPTSDADIRKSLRMSLEGNKSTEDLVKENKHLKEAVEILKKEFELTDGKTPDESKIRTAAGRILKKYSSKFDKDTLVQNITQVYKYLRQDGADFDEALKVMSEIAKGVLQDTELKDTSMKEQYKDLYNHLTKEGIYLSDTQLEELGYTGGTTQFKRDTGIKINKEGKTTLDQQWQEWEEEYPELFPTGTNEGDMPYVLAGILDSISERIETLDGNTIDQMAYDVAMEIYGELAKVPVKETFADTKEKEKDQALSELADSYEKILEDYREDIRKEKAETEDGIKDQIEQERKRREAQIIAKIKDNQAHMKVAKDPKTLEGLKKKNARLEESLKRARSKQAEIMAEARAKYQKRRLKEAERRSMTETKDRIRKLHQKFRTMIVKPSETMYVPKDLMQAAIETCELVNLGAKPGSELFKKLDDARRIFKQIKSDTETYGVDDFDPRIEGDLENLSLLMREKGEDFSIYDLTEAELREVYNCMNEIYESIRLSTKLIREQGEKDVRRAGRRVIEDLEKVKGIKDNIFSRASNKITTSFLNAYREFRRLSGYNDNSELMEMYQELNKGQRDSYAIQMEGEQRLQKVTARKDMEDLMNELDDKKGLVKVPLRFEKSTSPVYITKGMRLALILHGESYSNLNHMEQGGVMIPAKMEKYSKNKKEAYEQTRKVVGINEATINQMKAELSAKERELLAVFEDFFHDWTGEKVNKTALDLYGFKKARVQNYYPISVDKDYVTTDISALKFDKTIEGAGFLKERINSVKPIILESVIDTAERSLNAVSLFSGLAIPIRNFNKIMNVTTYKATEAEDALPGVDTAWTVDTSVKKKMREVWGDRALRFIDDVIADLQQGRKREVSWYDKLRGNYAGAVLTANASVIIKQTSAYPTCAGVMGWSPTLKAFLRGGKNNWMLSKADQELINKYTPIYWYRNKGNATRELAEIRETNTLMNKYGPVRFVKDAIQKVDMAMVGRFWYAAQYYIDSTRKDLKKGTDAYYQEVAKVFDRCVEETQSTNMTLQNADIMRNPNDGMKIITMFMGQGLQNFGMVYDNFNNMRAKRKQLKDGTIDKKAYHEAVKGFARAVSSQVVSAAMFAGLAIIARGLLHRMNPYRDDKQEVTGEGIFYKWLDDMGENIVGSVPLGSLVYEWVMSAATGERTYGQDDIVLGALNDLEDSTIKLFKAISKGEGVGDAILSVANDGSKLFGVPVENVANLVNGTINHVKDITKGEGFLSYSSDAKNVSENVWGKYLVEAIKDGDTQSKEKYVEAIVDLGKTEDDVARVIGKQLKDDEEVKKAAEAKKSGNMNEYANIKLDLMKKGYPESSIEKAVKSLNTPKKEKEKPDPEVTKERMKQAGSLYDAVLGTQNKQAEFSGNDITAAVDSGKQSSIDSVVKAIIKDKQSQGIDKEEATKKATTSIKQALTKAYKGAYLEGNATEKQKIMKLLQRVKIDGKVIYDQETFKKWYKDSQKK